MKAQFIHGHERQQPVWSNAALCLSAQEGPQPLLVEEVGAGIGPLDWTGTLVLLINFYYELFSTANQYFK